MPALRLVPDEDNHSDLFVLTVPFSQEEATVKVFIQIRNVGLVGACTCLGGLNHLFCEHLWDVCLGRVSLIYSQDRIKMREIVKAIQRTPFARHLKERTQAVYEMKKAIREVAAKKKGTQPKICVG